MLLLPGDENSWLCSPAFIQQCLSVLEFTPVCDATLRSLFCHHLPTSWPLCALDVGCWLAMFLSTVSSNIISKLLAHPASEPRSPSTLSFFREFYFQFTSALLGLVISQMPLWNLDPGEPLLGTHSVLLALVCPPVVPLPWALQCLFSGFLLPPSPFSPAVDSRESRDCHLTNILIFSLSELVP